MRGFRRVKHDRLVFHVIGGKVVGHSLNGTGARLQANRGAVELFGALDTELLGNHEALTIVVVDGCKDSALRSVTGKRPGGIARQNVNLARLQRRKALRRRKRHELYLLSVAEYGCSHSAAGVDIKTGPLTFAVGTCKTRGGGIDTADHLPARLDGVQNGAGIGGRAKCKQSSHCTNCLDVHFFYSLCGVRQAARSLFLIKTVCLSLGARCTQL